MNDEQGPTGIFDVSNDNDPLDTIFPGGRILPPEIVSEKSDTGWIYIALAVTAIAIFLVLAHYFTFVAE